jgi:AraC-like DNA-binding protein
MGTGSFTLQKYSPRGELSRYVQSIWVLDVAGSSQPELRYMHPDGGSGLSFSYGAQNEIDGIVRPAGITLRSQLHEPKAMRFVSPLHMVGVRFHPGGAFPFFGVSAPNEETCTPRELMDLYERIGDANGPAETLAILEGWLTHRFGRSELSPLAAEALRALRAGHRALRVERIAESLDVTSRHLERLFRTQVGYPPKLLARIFRARRAKKLLAARPGLPLSDIAYDLGYADQAHFTREFKSVIGLTPASYRACLARSLPPETEKGRLSATF